MSTETKYHPRFVKQALNEALADSPAVLIHGPRQCGKTTLAKRVGLVELLWNGERLKWNEETLLWDGSKYITFDDEVARSAADADPIGFVGDLPDKVILDEVQRVPSIFSALKLEIDRQRSPGRFLLTGSAQVLLVPKLSDSLAGRLEILRLHPLAQCELSGNLPSFLNRLFAGNFETVQISRLSDELIGRIVGGGYPAALQRATERRRRNWYVDYVETQLQRDVRDMAQISDLGAMSRLLNVAATQTARLYNLLEMSTPFQLSRPTIGKYVELLERVFLLERVPAWQNSRLKRLIKAPKLHIGDSGLGCALIGANSQTLKTDRELLGQYLETFVYQELRRQASWFGETLSFFHYRDKDKAEVDIVIERGAMAVAGVEVKASSTVRDSDFIGLRRLRNVIGKRFAAGVVLYDGETCAGFGDGMYAVPIRFLWEN